MVGQGLARPAVFADRVCCSRVLMGACVGVASVWWFCSPGRGRWSPGGEVASWGPVSVQRDPSHCPGRAAHRPTAATPPERPGTRHGIEVEHTVGSWSLAWSRSAVLRSWSGPGADGPGAESRGRRGPGVGRLCSGSGVAAGSSVFCWLRLVGVHGSGCCGCRWPRSCPGCGSCRARYSGSGWAAVVGRVVRLPGSGGC